MSIPVSTQQRMFHEIYPVHQKRQYGPFLTAEVNGKGALDIDTVKGCTLGMQAYPDGGCYGECYALKIAMRYGFDFTVSVSRYFLKHLWKGYRHLDTINKIIQANPASWYRIGTAGDPCHDWPNTLKVCEALRPMCRIPVIITKHWIPLTDEQVVALWKLSAVVNTSMSGMDTDDEISYRVGQLVRLADSGVKSVCRVVTCDYGDTAWAKSCKDKQEYLLSLEPVIDNPLRACQQNPHVLNGDIHITRKKESIGGGKFVSLHQPNVYLGTCAQCPDQCGVD